MIISIIPAGMAAAFSAGAPLLPVLLVGALIQAGVAFALTRNWLCVQLGASIVVVSVLWLILPSLTHRFDYGPILLTMVDFLVGVTAVTVLAFSTTSAVLERRP